jgi:hypothetical protein
MQQHGSSMNDIHLLAVVNTLGNWQQQGKLSGQTQLQQLLADVDSLLLPEILDQCECFGLAQLVWGLGLLGHTEAGLFSDCLGRFMQQIDQAGRAQQVSNVLYGVAKAGWQMEGGQVQQLLAALVRLLPDAKPQEVANSLWAAASMDGTVTAQHLQQLMQHLTSKLANASTQEVANSLWAQHLTDQQQQQLQQSQHLQQLLPGLAGKLAAAKPQEVSNSLWACAQLRVYPAELFAALNSQQQWGRLVQGMTGQGLANTALACAVLFYRDEQLLAGLLRSAAQKASSSSIQLTTQNVCNLCWSVAVLDVQQLAGSVLQLVQVTGSSQQWREFTVEDLFQLHQVHLWL